MVSEGKLPPTAVVEEEEEPVEEERPIGPIPPPEPGRSRTARASALAVFKANPGVWMKLAEAYEACRAGVGEGAAVHPHSYTGFRQAVQQLVRAGDVEAEGATASRVYRKTSEPDHDDAEEGLRPDDPAGEAEEEDHDGAGHAGEQGQREHRGSSDGGRQSGTSAAATADGASDGEAETPPAAAPDREPPTDEEVILAVHRAKEPISAYELKGRFGLEEEEMEEILDRLAAAGSLASEENQALGTLYSFGSRNGDGDSRTELVSAEVVERREGKAEEKPLVDRVADFIDAADGEVYRTELVHHFPELENSARRIPLMEQLRNDGRLTIIAPSSRNTRYRSSKKRRPTAGSSRRPGVSESAEALGDGTVHLSDRTAERADEEKTEQREAKEAAKAALPAARQWVRGAGTFNARQVREVFELEPRATTRLLGLLTSEGLIEQVGEERAGAYRAVGGSNDNGTTLEARAFGACSMGDGATLHEVQQKLGVTKEVAQKVLSKLYKDGEVKPKSKGGKIRYMAAA